MTSNQSNPIKNLFTTTPVLVIIESFFSTWAIMSIGHLHPMNVIGFFLFFCILLSFSFIRSSLKREIQQNAKKQGNKQNVLSLLLSLLFTCFYLSDTYKDLVSHLRNPLFQAIILLVTALGLFILLYKCILFLMYKQNDFSLADTSKYEKWIPRLPFLCFVLCVLCRIPYLLYSFPGIMTPDSINQIEQFMGMQPFSNHHPWVHTLTISLFYHIGAFFTTSVNHAFVFYTVFQIIFMAFAAGYLIRVLISYTKSLPLLLGIIAFYAFMPYHNIMAICIWKDVLFSGSVLLFTTSLLHLLKEGICKTTRGSLGIYIVSGILMCLYRSNGWYAFLLSFPFLLISFRKIWKIMVPVHMVILLFVCLIKGPVMDYYEVEQPDFTESISIPLQQVGRVIATGNELTDSQKEQLEKIMDITYVPSLYTEYISDNMKELVRAGNPEYLTSHKGDYFRLWVQLGLQYPGVYLDAYIAQTHGYYSPNAVYTVAEADGVVANEVGLYQGYLLSGKLLVKVREILIKLQTIIPFYGALWSMGSLFWGVLFFLTMSLGRKNSFFAPGTDSIWHCITLWMPNIAVIATLLIATPVAVEFRYAYTLAYCIPLYFAVMLLDSPQTTFEMK